MSKVTLGQVATEVRESTKDPARLPIVGLEHLIPGEIRLTQWSETSENTFTKLFHKGQVLFGRRRAYQKKAAVADFDGVCSGDITVIAAKPDRLLPDLLPFIVNDDRFFDFAMEKSAGSLSPRVKWAQLAEYAFDLPDDIEEQRSHAKLLWAIERSRSAYQNLLSQMDELIKSQFVEQFGDCITNEKKWTVLPLCDVLDEGCTVTYGIVKTEDDIPGGIPVFRPVDISQGHVPTRNELKRTSKAISDQYRRTLLQGNELLITVRGSIGETFQTSDEFAGCNVARNIVPLRANPTILRQSFLKIVIDSPAFQQKLADLTKGVALKGINMNEFKYCPIILPPLEMQDKFSAFVQQTDKSKYDNNLNAANTWIGGDMCA